MKITGKGDWRVYFNRSHEKPRVWSISPDTPLVDEIPIAHYEIEVRSLAIKAPLWSRYHDRVTPHPEGLGPPSAYFVVRGVLVVDKYGHATIEDGAE